MSANPKTATATVPKIDPSTYDPALLAAWRRFLDYDRASSSQKQIHQRTRQWIILLGAFASALAVLSTYLGGGGPLRVLLIILPIASVGLMNYAAQFSTSTGWIEYRVSAELIRSQIYLYRLNSGGYKDKDPHVKQAQLLTEINNIDRWMIQHNLSMPQIKPISDTDLIQQATSKTEGKDDDGFRPIDAGDYIDWRAQGQFGWYINKIAEDHSAMRRNRILALVIAGAGSVLAGVGFGLEGLVAVTTALGTALTLISEVRMYGRTYHIYYEAAFELQTALNEWKVLPPEQRTPEKKAEFVTRFEAIFDKERTQWREQTIKIQMSNEQAIYTHVQQVAGSQAEALVSPQSLEVDFSARPGLSLSRTQVAVEKKEEIIATVEQVSEGQPAADAPAPPTEPVVETIEEALQNGADAIREALPQAEDGADGKPASREH
ncbi:MAG: DUF4231 domain-containing protein [Chloroflexi bacterium]|nr:DUF4231 domain-containing protein [Chloroflexota bacterium]